MHAGITKRYSATDRQFEGIEARLQGEAVRLHGYPPLSCIVHFVIAYIANRCDKMRTFDKDAAHVSQLSSTPREYYGGHREDDNDSLLSNSSFVIQEIGVRTGLNPDDRTVMLSPDGATPPL